MKKQNKSKLSPKSDSQRETRFLLEQIHSEVKTVAEQHGSIMGKLKEHDLRFDKIDQKLTEHGLKFIKIEKKLTEHDSMFKSMHLAVTDIDTKAELINKKLDTTLANHEQRLQKLEIV